jgi:hypothetical protein
MESKTINYENKKTELCRLGEKYGTDKSPFNTRRFIHGGPGHRHPYTCFYNDIFSNIKSNKLKILEIGILEGKSIYMLNEYFQNSNIIATDNVHGMKDELNKLRNVTFDHIDVNNINSIENICSKYGPFDIIIDDSSHKFNDQIRVIETTFKYVNKGGVLIIEDIMEDKNIFLKYNNEIYRTMTYFNKEDAVLANKVSIEELYNLKLKEEYKKCGTFYTLRHNNSYTPGWNNNKILVFSK